jgi:hypothetical protein
VTVNREVLLMTMRRALASVRRWIAPLLLFCALLTVPLLAQKTVHVKGYVKKDGTVVKPYDRRAPGSTPPVTTTTTAPAPPTAPVPATTTPAATPTTAPVATVVLEADDPRGTVTAIAPIFLTPDANRTPLRTAAINTTLRVLENNGEWLKVEFQDPQYGRRMGHVQSKNVRLSESALRPMDLSIPSEPPAAERTLPLPVASAPAVSRAENGSLLPAAASETVYVTRTGAKYHRAGCRSLAKSAIPMKLSDAARVYGPCSVCRPPTPSR